MGSSADFGWRYQVLKSWADRIPLLHGVLGSRLKPVLLRFGLRVRRILQRSFPCLVLP